MSIFEIGAGPYVLRQTRPFLFGLAVASLALYGAFLGFIIGVHHGEAGGIEVIRASNPTPDARSAGITHAAEEMGWISRRTGPKERSGSAWWCHDMGHVMRCRVLFLGEDREILHSSWYDCPAWTVVDPPTTVNCMSTDRPGREILAGEVVASGEWSR